MASLYKRSGSPFWWIKYRNPLGIVTRESTNMKIGVGPDTRRARELCAERTLAERKAVKSVEGEQWSVWVTEYLQQRYANSAASLSRYSTIWRNLSMWIEEKEIFAPRHVTRELCLAYIPWRTEPNRMNGKYKVGHNTAALELKILGLLMAEAVRRGFAPFNPCRDLEVKKARPQEKPEFSDADIEFIRQKIADEPEPERTFLENSLEIARYQGCRLSETYLNPMADVDLRAQSIRFRAKGNRIHVAPLHPGLVPLFEKLSSERKTETYQRPPNPSRKWFDFFKRIGMRERKPGACFHSLRVTVVTRLARSNVPEAKAMRFVGHASTTVHRTYQRLRMDDLGDCLSALK